MKLSELVDREGLASIHDKTNISIEILLKLLDGDFEEISRVRALGFSSILKREYDVELDELDSAIKECFKEVELETPESVIVTVEKKDRDSGYIKWIIIVALLAGLWYLYNSGQLGGNLSNESGNENRLKDSEILKTNTSDGDAQQSVIIKKDDNNTKVEIQTEGRPLKIAESNSTTESESNQTKESNSTKVKNSTNSKSKDKETKDKDKKSEETADIENSLDETIKESDDETTSSTKKASTSTGVNDDDIAEIIYTVTVNPRVNLWFGFINIDTKERKEFMTTASTAIDVGEQRWILMTGHGRLTVASGTKTLEINDRAKHYFYIDSSAIREINRKEFKKFNSGKGW